MRKTLTALVALSLAVSIFQPGLAQSPEQGPVVRGVLFWMDGCPHCHIVIDEVLPPLQAKYRDQLKILHFEITSMEEVDLLYQVAASFGIPKEEVGVPFLVLGDHVLKGSDQIPRELPGLIENYLAGGGVDYPDLPILAEILRSLDPDYVPCVPDEGCEDGGEDLVQAPPGPQPENPSGDQVVPAGPLYSGFEAAIAIMIGMLAALVYTGFAIFRALNGSNTRDIPNWMDISIPILALAGLGIAGYLVYVESTPADAICGPVGDCHAVQNSSYAKLYGVPVSLLGGLAYLIILAAWVIQRRQTGGSRDVIRMSIFGVAFAGTLFSLYLTYLEPFVIQAVCAWCLTSAAIITVLMLFSVTPMLRAVSLVGDDD